MVGIILSTIIEADIILNRLDKKETFSIQGKLFYKGILCNATVTICICGIGKANAAHSAALIIERFRPDIIYNIGIGGAYPFSGLSIGDIIIAEKEIYGDEGLLSKDGLHTINEILDIQNEFIMHIPKEFKDIKDKGIFITVSTCTGTFEKGREIEKKFNALCENMEGAAIAQICSFSNIPVVEIRGISNIIQDRTAKLLNKNDISMAAENMQKFFLDKFI